MLLKQFSTNVSFSCRWGSTHKKGTTNNAIRKDRRCLMWLPSDAHTAQLPSAARSCPPIEKLPASTFLRLGPFFPFDDRASWRTLWKILVVTMDPSVNPGNGNVYFRFSLPLCHMPSGRMDIARFRTTSEMNSSTPGEHQWGPVRWRRCIR